jgi:hypothetical protein
MIRARRIWLSDLPQKNCSDDFSPKSLILLIATIDSAQVGLSPIGPFGKSCEGRQRPARTKAV